MSRRAEYAETTRAAIIDAARQLFAERGYFSTRVDDIAALARVAPATVYAVCGGKQDLLQTLIDSWKTAPIIAATLSSVAKLENPDKILCVTAECCRRMREEFGDIVRVMLTTAPHDAGIGKELASATAVYREGLRPIGQRLSDLGALRDGVSVDLATDLLWFYFGYWSIFTLHDDNGWTYERAEEWLCRQASRTLIRDAPATSDQAGNCQELGSR